MFRSFIFLILFFSSQITMALSYTVELSEAQLQKRVASIMPIKKKKLFFKIILSDPKIELLDGSNEIGIFTHIEIKSKIGIKGTGRAKIVGSLSFEPETGEFFFKNTKLLKLEVDKVSEKNNQQIRTLVQAVGGKLLEKKPIYRLKDDDLKHKLAKSMLQSIAIKDKKLLLKLSVL